MVFILVTMLLIIILGATLKKEYSIHREITVQKSKQEVFEYIKLLRNQNEYSYYNRKDPNTIKSYSGIDGEVGFKYTWSSKMSSIGSGTQIISKIIDGEMMCCDIQFTKPTHLKSYAEIALISVNENQTKVSWTFKSVYTFPLNIIIYFFNLEKLIGNDIASSLITLKEKLEDQN